MAYRLTVIQVCQLILILINILSQSNGFPVSRKGFLSKRIAKPASPTIPIVAENVPETITDSTPDPVHKQSPIQQPLDQKPKNQFLFTTCQGGSEKALKEEFAKYYPSLSFAFSRPGLVTWKSQDEVLPDFEVKSTFTRCYGASIGQRNTSIEIYELAKTVVVGDEQLSLHVYARDETSARSAHPLAISAKKLRVDTLYSELLALDSTKKHRLFSDVSSHVLDVIVGAEDEKHFIGHHIACDAYIKSHDWIASSLNRFKWRNHSPYIGGIANINLPDDAPSRAYLKIEELVAWAGLSLSKNDVALEIGSAPGIHILSPPLRMYWYPHICMKLGGVCYALLQRGLRVYGLDPSPPDRMHHSVVAGNPRFTGIKATLDNVHFRTLPDSVEWLLCDANISPEEAMPRLLLLLDKYKDSLKGFMYTVKLGEELWGRTSREPLIDYLNRIVGALVEKTSLEAITTTQLSSNRQEVTLVGLSSKGLSECRFPVNMGVDAAGV